jgi:hypothetical protein
VKKNRIVGARIDRVDIRDTTGAITLLEFAALFCEWDSILQRALRGRCRTFAGSLQRAR